VQSDNYKEGVCRTSDGALERRIVGLQMATSVAASGAFFATAIAAHEAQALIVDDGAEESIVQPTDGGTPPVCSPGK
jgi:hypothetical protein